MNVTLREVVQNEKGDFLKNENGDKLCEINDDKGEIFMMYLSDEDIYILTRKIGEAASETEDEETEVVEQPSTSKRFKWPIGISQFLLDKYIELHVHVGPMKKFRNKPEMWQVVVKMLKDQFDFYCTTDQCESHLKSIKRAYARDEKKRKTSGSAHINSPYAEGMAKLKVIDDSVQPEVLVGIGQQQRLKPQKKTDSGEDIKKGKKEEVKNVYTKQNKVIQAIYDIYEKTQEKIDGRFNKMCDVLREIANQNRQSTSNEGRNNSQPSTSRQTTSDDQSHEISSDSE